MVENGNSVDGALELAELTTRIARTIRRAGSAQLAPLGITFGQARLLRLLSGVGSLRMNEIAARMDVVPRSATDMVDGLVAAGLAERRADPADRRSILVELTEAGLDRLRRMGAARKSVSQEVFGRLDDRQRAELAALLRIVAGNSAAGKSAAGGEERAGRGCGNAERGECR